uniref:Photolyase/cryptochrome alpha/beta domain-containing protein n=1 Tax=Athene cunicularia TaxID=194338 RepID=A0A663LPR9_ATHCN
WYKHKVAAGTARMPRHTVHLFWKGLWLLDKPTLLAVMESSVIYPVCILDRKFMMSMMHTGALRWHFLLRSLEVLQKNLWELGSCLLVIQGESVPRDHIHKWNIMQVALDAEMEPFCKEMAANVRCLGDELGFEVLSLVGHSLCDTKRYVIVLKTSEVSPGRFISDLTSIGEKRSLCRASPPLSRSTLPPNWSLSPWRGDETQGLQRLEEHLTDQGWVASSTKPRTVLNSLLPNTTGLSPYFSMGCLSVRNFFYRLSNIYAQAKHHSLPPVWLQGQLLWREPCGVASAIPNFTRMVGNPICLQVSWYEDAERLHKQRKTGIPWIDVVMTPLCQEGWIHHLARHTVGMKVHFCFFLLLDADYSISTRNWMWMSASAFFHQVESSAPSTLGSTWTPRGRTSGRAMAWKYLPILKNFPSKYISEDEQPLKRNRSKQCVSQVIH